MDFCCIGRFFFDYRAIFNTRFEVIKIEQKFHQIAGFIRIQKQNKIGELVIVHIEQDLIESMA